MTTLIEAVKNGNLQLVKSLISAGVEYKHLSVVELLQTAGG